MKVNKKISYARKVGLRALWRGLQPGTRGPVHLIFTIADHFEPAIDPEDGYRRRAGREEQEERVEWWCREYPKVVERWRDADGRPFVHTYFYPAEQYDEPLIAALASHCHEGFGEIEVHLHHGVFEPDTAENTSRVLAEFRDRLAFRHRCLAVEEGSKEIRYAFVHGNWALANSADGWLCGVDSEVQVLAATGCYADMTMPTTVLHTAQIAKINSVYECGLPLDQKIPHREGHDLRVGRAPKIFPLMVQGPLIANVAEAMRGRKQIVETGEINETKLLTMERLALWKRADIHVQGRPDWLFIKLHCHGMNPRQKDAVAGNAFRKFMAELVEGAAERKEILHFATAREMTNILLAACDGREGDPGQYRDYRLKRFDGVRMPAEVPHAVPVSQEG